MDDEGAIGGVVVDGMSTSEAVAVAVDAVRADDAERIALALTRLALSEPPDVIEAALTAVLAARQKHGAADVPVAPLMPDPALSAKLLRAVEQRDPARLLEWAEGDYGRLLTGLVGLAAALRPR